jgi:hypothetical protein
MGDLLGDIVSAGQSAISNATSWGQGAASTVGNAISGAESAGQSAISSAQQAGSNIMSSAGETGSQFLSGVSSVNQAAGKLAAAETGVIFAPAVAALGSAAIGAKLIGDAWSSRSSEGNAGITFEQPSTEKKSGSSKSGGAAYTNKYSDQKGGVTANWIEPISNRPGFKKTEDLGLDRKTWSLISEGYTPLQAVTMRLQEETKPSVRRELDWQQNQLAENKIEVSSDYHNWATDTGKPQSINPFANEGDMALALKQGTRQEGKLQISGSNPGVSGLFADLPGGKGLEDVSWDQAKTGFTQKSPDFMKAVDRVEAARYDPGVYGDLNSNRNYIDWNKARPEEQVNVVSMDELLYGNTRSHKVPALYGSFGRKTEPKTKPQIKKYDKSIHETLFGPMSTAHKQVVHKTPVKWQEVTEWGLLSEFGIRRPTAKKPENSLKDDFRYTKERGNFQGMRKPTTSIRNVVLDELEELENSGIIQKKLKKNQKKSVRRKGVK